MKERGWRRKTNGLNINMKINSAIYWKRPSRTIGNKENK